MTAIAEGELDFKVLEAGKTCKTWYKIVGDLKNGKTPLVILHGGKCDFPTPT